MQKIIMNFKVEKQVVLLQMLKMTLQMTIKQLNFMSKDIPFMTLQQTFNYGLAIAKQLLMAVS